jgi:hypothetical protein
VTYNPVSDGHESLSIYLQIGGTQYVIRGARGTCTFELNASQIPYLKFEFKGLFTLPIEAVRANPTLAAFKKPLPVNNVNTPTFTLKGQDMVMRSFMLNMGNQVEGRFLVGEEEILIVDRADNIDTKVKAKALAAAFNPYALALGEATLPIVLKHGTVAGNIAQIDVAKAQMQRPQGLENTQNIVEWPLRMIPVPTNGNDHWTLTLT